MVMVMQSIRSNRNADIQEGMNRYFGWYERKSCGGYPEPWGKRAGGEIPVAEKLMLTEYGVDAKGNPGPSDRISG